MSTIQPSLIADVTLYPFLPPSGVPLIGASSIISFLGNYDSLDKQALGLLFWFGQAGALICAGVVLAYMTGQCSNACLWDLMVVVSRTVYQRQAPKPYIEFVSEAKHSFITRGIFISNEPVQEPALLSKLNRWGIDLIKAGTDPSRFCFTSIGRDNYDIRWVSPNLRGAFFSVIWSTWKFGVETKSRGHITNSRGRATVVYEPKVYDTYVSPWDTASSQSPETKIERQKGSLQLSKHVGLSLDGEQGKECHNNIRCRDADHKQFRDTRLWSRMIGIVMFIVGCATAYQGGRLWIYLGRARTSFVVLAISFGCLFCGQAFVLFGFWWEW